MKGVFLIYEDDQSLEIFDQSDYEKKKLVSTIKGQKHSSSINYLSLIVRAKKNNGSIWISKDSSREQALKEYLAGSAKKLFPEDS